MVFREMHHTHPFIDGRPGIKCTPAAIAGTIIYAKQREVPERLPQDRIQTSVKVFFSIIDRKDNGNGMGMFHIANDHAGRLSANRRRHSTLAKMSGVRIIL